jgi:hypothetical protein
VEAALSRALTLPGAELRLLDYWPTVPSRCSVLSAEIARPISASGRAALHLFGKAPSGEGCEGWAWANVQVFAPVLVTSRALREGEPLGGAVRPVMREVAQGRSPLRELPPQAVATHDLPAGAALLESDQRSGPRLGDTVAVVIRVGFLEVEQQGRAVPCVPGRTCAVLPSGKRVEGSYSQGKLLLEAP